MTTNAHVITATSWHHEDPATPALIPAMLDDIGVDAGAARESTHRYCLKMIKEEMGISMGDLQDTAAVFWDGYLACLRGD